MQHPDEGMIHSWLDGALSTEEAARVESHVSECASCAATVAEARGFIAASSRILTALDDVPRGVLPAVPAKRRDFRIVWRAAAAMLIVAGGSFVVMREGGPDALVTGIDVVPFKPLDQTAVAATAPSAVTENAESIREAKPLASADTATTPPAPAAPPVASARRAESPRQSDLSTGADVERAKAPNALRMQMNEAVAESDAAPLKVVRIERSVGSRHTVYEIAPSATVTLTETESPQLSGIVATGSAAAATSGIQQRNATRGARIAQPMSAEAAKAPPPPPPSQMMDSRSGADSTSRAEIGATAKMAFTAATNTISWTEPKTGKTLTLSGNVSVERLQEIRKRIEKERASAAQN